MIAVPPTVTLDNVCALYCNGIRIVCPVPPALTLKVRLVPFQIVLLSWVAARSSVNVSQSLVVSAGNPCVCRAWRTVSVTHSLKPA